MAAAVALLESAEARVQGIDVVHYNAGSSILPWSFSGRWASRGSPKWMIYTVYANVCRMVERSLLHNKVVAVTFQGDDARQGDYCRQHFDISIAHETGSSYYTPASDERTRAAHRMVR